MDKTLRGAWEAVCRGAACFYTHGQRYEAQTACQQAHIVVVIDVGIETLVAQNSIPESRHALLPERYFLLTRLSNLHDPATCTPEIPICIDHFRSQAAHSDIELRDEASQSEVKAVRLLSC